MKEYEYRLDHYPSEKIKSRASYKDGKLHGKRIEYYESGKICKEGTYDNGHKDGQWVAYYVDGGVEYKGEGSLWIPGSCLEGVIPPAYLGAVRPFSLPSNQAFHHGQYPKSHR